MIPIKKSPTADTRTCDFASVSQQTLRASSYLHIDDVRCALEYFTSLIDRAAQVHDRDKITDIKGFHADFVTGFKEHGWWDRHKAINRHHLNEADGVREDVNLIDVLDYIADCTMAGMARSGSVRPIEITPAVLMQAFINTCRLLRDQVVVEE